MNKKVRSAVIVFAVLLCSCRVFRGQSFNLHPNQGDLTPMVSMIQLIANPQRYNGKKIKVIGYLRIEFEGDSIYLHEEDLKHSITANAVWIDLPKLTTEQRTGLNNRYVLCTATFNAGRHGHMGMFGGELGDVQRLEAWRMERDIGTRPSLP